MTTNAAPLSLNKELLEQHGLAFKSELPTWQPFAKEHIKHKNLAKELRANTWPRMSTRAPGEPRTESKSLKDALRMLDAVRDVLGPPVSSDHWPCTRFVVEGLLGDCRDLTKRDVNDIENEARKRTQRMMAEKIKRQNKARVKRLTRQGRNETEV